MSFKNRLSKTGSAGFAAGLGDGVAVATVAPTAVGATDGAGESDNEGRGEATGEDVALGEPVVETDAATLGDGEGVGKTLADGAAAVLATVVIVGKIFPDNNPPVNIMYNTTEKIAPLIGERKTPNLPWVSIENAKIGSPSPDAA